VSVRWCLMYDVFAYLDRYVALKCIFSAVIYHGGVYITNACTFSTLHNNIHFCFTLLVTLAFHSYWSRVFQSRVFSRAHTVVWWTCQMQCLAMLSPFTASSAPASETQSAYVGRRLPHCHILCIHINALIRRRQTIANYVGNNSGSRYITDRILCKLLHPSASGSRTLIWYRSTNPVFIKVQKCISQT